MSEKTFNTRIQHKHDTEANWKKATNFIPLQGEIIVYDADDYNPVQRIKVGDGETTVSNLPFSVRQIKEIEYSEMIGSDYHYVIGTTSGGAFTQGIDKKVYIGGGANSGELHADKFIGVATEATLADMATNDSAGNKITSTYLKDVEINIELNNQGKLADKKLILTKGDSTQTSLYLENIVTSPELDDDLFDLKCRIEDEIVDSADDNHNTLAKLGILIDENQDAIEALETVAAGKANKEHDHVAADVSDLSTTLSAYETKEDASDKLTEAKIYALEQAQFYGLPVVTTTGTGAAYVATVPGVTELVSGACFIMNPHTNSTSISPTLNVNGLGAKTIYRQGGSTGTNSMTNGGSDSWLIADRPVILIFQKTAWVVQGLARPTASDLSGTVPVNKGGTGRATLTSGSYLVGNGTSAVTLKTPAAVLADIGAISEEDAKLYTDDKIQEYHASMIVDNYLPLTGGAMTGEITLGQGDGNGIQLGTSGYINATKDNVKNNTVLGISGSDALIGSIAFNTTLRGFANRPTYNGVDMALYSDVNKCATSDHTHGLLNHYLNIVIPATTEGGSWNIIDEKASNTGGMLKAIRMGSQAPEWLEDNYGTGIFFGGGDTRGAISLAYNKPSITLAGGNNTRSKNWHIKMTGTAGTTYNLDNIGKISDTAVLITVEEIDAICGVTA